ncbi:hypothetical protein cyc_05571 [Cyclospora cayetanensis]|uniref:Uncharacterized protein n=1 Tax=Cyclospora cayetanensis TaxID=88456 RepID=A0A1D3D187_9EIME|nr:hypothetical protein cyc_05571 [Cyclospora cayetanensis]
MRPFIAASSRLVVLPLAVMSLWACSGGVFSTPSGQQISLQLDGILSDSGAHELLDLASGSPSQHRILSIHHLGYEVAPTHLGMMDEKSEAGLAPLAALQLSPTLSTSQEYMDAVLQNAEVPLEVRKTAFRSDDIKALGLLLTTSGTFFSKTTQRNLFLVLSSYYKIYSLFRACAVAYGLGYLFSKVDQVAGLPNLLVTTLTSLFLNHQKHNLYASLISTLGLPETVAGSLGGFIQQDMSRTDSYTNSSVMASLKNAMITLTRDVLDPRSIADLIDMALMPAAPSAVQLIRFSTDKIDVAKFKKKFPFAFGQKHTETIAHAFTEEMRKPGTPYYKALHSLQSIALPILAGHCANHWDTIVNSQVYPLMQGISVKAQELSISLMKHYALKLPSLLEMSNRDVDYRAFIATNWGPMVGALSNWEAKASGDDILSAKRGTVSYTQIGAWELYESVRGAPPDTRLTLSISDEAVPLEFELLEPPSMRIVNALKSFPKTVRPERSAFGYAGKMRLAVYPRGGLFTRIRNSVITRTQKSHGPKIVLSVKQTPGLPGCVAVVLRSKRKVVELRVRPLHLLQGIDPMNCAARRGPFPTMDGIRNKLAHGWRAPPSSNVPGLGVQVSYPKAKLDNFTSERLSPILKLLFPLKVVGAIHEHLRRGMPFQLAGARGIKDTINYIKEWHRAKKLLKAAYQEANDLEIQQDLSPSHSEDRRDLEIMLKRNGVNGMPFSTSIGSPGHPVVLPKKPPPREESWALILNSTDGMMNIRWEVLDLDASSDQEMIVKAYGQEFGNMAALAVAADEELKASVELDHVLRRMKNRLFDYSYKQTLYLESPGAFLQQFLMKGDEQDVAAFEQWLLRRLQGNFRGKTCRAESFYGKAFAQYSDLVAYYDRKDPTAVVPDLEEAKRFLLIISLPKGHLIRIKREDDSTHSGVYKLVERIDRCTFLLEDANGIQVTTDGILHTVRSFEDGDQVSHEYVQRRRFSLTEANGPSGVCTIRDRNGYQFKLRSTETTPICVGHFSHHSTRLQGGLYSLSDPKAAYNSLMDAKANYVVEMEIEQTIMQDCYSGLSCVVRDDRDLPIKVHYAIPDELMYEWAGTWLWLFLNGLHSEYLSIVSNRQYVRSREDAFWIQRTADELEKSCWDLEDEAALSLNRDFLAPDEPSLISRIVGFLKSSDKGKAVPNRCTVPAKGFSSFFPGVPKVSLVSSLSPTERFFMKQTARMVSRMSSAAYLLRREREESALFALRQHFRKRNCGRDISCASWWLKARELRGAVILFSGKKAQRMTAKREEYFLIEAYENTGLTQYWIRRVCSMQQSFGRLFSRLRLPEEADGVVPCSSVSAFVILATIMSDITLLMRRRALAVAKQRMMNTRKVLSFLDGRELPRPCHSDLLNAADLLRHVRKLTTTEECESHDSQNNYFLYLKSQVDALHVQVDDVIQHIRRRFSSTLASRLSPPFISTNENAFRHQAADIEAMDKEISDLYASLFRPFEVWQGTFRHRQREEMLDIRMQQQCPFRAPRPTRHAREDVYDAEYSSIEERATRRYKQTVLLFTGLFLLQVAARGEDFARSMIQFIHSEAATESVFKESTWPVLAFLQRQTVTYDGDSTEPSDEHCDVLKQLRWGIDKLGLKNGQKTVSEAIEGLMRDPNFAEVSSFLPPPVEGVDAEAFPVGFLRIQRGPTAHSTLVTMSGDALFGDMSNANSFIKHFTADASWSYHLRESASTGCSKGSYRSVAVLRDVWSKIHHDIDSGNAQTGPSEVPEDDQLEDRVRQAIEDALRHTRTQVECQDQTAFFLKEIVKVVSHNGVVQNGDRAWRGDNLVVLEKRESGVKYVQSQLPSAVNAPPMATTDQLFPYTKVRVGDAVRFRGSSTTYELLHLAPISRTGCVSKLRQQNAENIVMTKQPLFRASGFQQGELVRKTSSAEVYEYMGTCGVYFEVKGFVTGISEWTTEDLMPLWDQLESAYPHNELHLDMVLILNEFIAKKGSTVSRLHFGKVLSLLESHKELLKEDQEALQKAFDLRANKAAFYQAINKVKELAAALEAKFKSKMSNNIPIVQVINIDRLRQLGQAAINAFHASGGEALQLPSVSEAVEPSTLSRIESPETTRPVDAKTLLRFLNYVGETIIPKNKALSIWEDYATTVRYRLQVFSKEQDAVDGYRKKLREQSTDLSGSTPALSSMKRPIGFLEDVLLSRYVLISSWADKILLNMAEKIGSFMRRELGNELSLETLENIMRPQIFEELVNISKLQFQSESDKEKVFGRLSALLAADISQLQEIRNPGRVPKREVLIDALALLRIKGRDVKRLEERFRLQYSQLLEKYTEQLVSEKVIDMEGVLDIIGQLEKMLGSMVTPLVDRVMGLLAGAGLMGRDIEPTIRNIVMAAVDEDEAESLILHSRDSPLHTPPPMEEMSPLVKISTSYFAKCLAAVGTASFFLVEKLTNWLIPDALINIPLIFWTPIRQGALGIGIQAALANFIGPQADEYIKLVQDSIWVAGVEPWLDSLRLQVASLDRFLKGMERGIQLPVDWWKQLPLLVFVKQTLDDIRSSVFYPSNLHTIWHLIKDATSASSGIYKLLMAPVKNLGAYVYLLLVELINSILPAENGDFLVPREALNKRSAQPLLDIAVANPKDLIKYLHRLLHVLLKVYVPMLRELFDTGIQLVLRKVAYHVNAPGTATLELWRFINQAAGYDLDGELEDAMREMFFRIGDEVLRMWPAMPVGDPQPWRTM